jgi:hypothetical protein
MACVPRSAISLQRPHRRRAPVEAGAADLTRFEQGHLPAELARLEGGGDPRRPPAPRQQADISVHGQIQSAVVPR